MTYIITKQKQKEYQYTFEDILFNRVPLNMFNTGDGKPGTITRCVEKINDEVLAKVSIQSIINNLTLFNVKHQNLHAANKETLYKTFYIPKKTGGLRRIDAPNDELKAALNELKNLLERACGPLYHTAAFAYIERRCTVDAMKKHQNNESNWFLKTDFSNFFPSITLDFTLKMSSLIFPLSEIMKDKNGLQQLTLALSLGFLNGGLPQGTPLSPMLTNIVMIPFDHTVFNELSKRKYVYTRYADDIHISCVQSFDKDKMVEYLRSVLRKFHAPFDIKDQKTRYGSRKGSNWNLGLMLNKDNYITVGHMKKKYFKAALNNFILDTLHDKPWSIDDVNTLQGNLSYYRSVEIEYINSVIQRFNEKYNVDVETMIHNQLTP